MGSNVLLGHDGTTPVYLRFDHRTAHVAILGKSRFGKTTLLEHLVLQDMGDGIAVIVIDAHGDLTKRLISLAPPAARDKIVLVEANGDRPFGLNLYECADPSDATTVTTTVGHVVDIFNKLMGSESPGYRPVIEGGLRSTAQVLIANGLTMADIPLLYSDREFRSAALSALPIPSGYWREYELSSPREQREKCDPVLNKIARFLEDGLVSLMVSQRKTTIPFNEVMDGGGTLILNLAGLDRDTVSFLGMVFLSAFSNLVHQRERIAERDRKRVHLYLDEYGRFATPTTRRLLEEGGKYGLGVTIAHQNLSQTPEREALHVETLIAFQMSGEDAQSVAKEFDCTPTRTKKVARQRTEPRYREWDEEVWDSEKSKKRYEELEESYQLLASQVEGLLTKADDPLFRIKYLEACLNHPGEDSHQGHVPIDVLRKWIRPPDRRSLHVPFNLMDSYFTSTVPLLKKFDPPPSGRFEYLGVARLPYPSSHWGEQEDQAVYERYRLASVPVEHTYVLTWFSNHDFGVWSYRRDIAKSLAGELERMLWPLYWDRDFYFRPTNNWALCEPTPPLGGERASHNWTRGGCWPITAFPEAVVWLRKKVSQLDTDWRRWNTPAVKLDLKRWAAREEADKFLEKHRPTIHHKEYLGEQPVQDLGRGVTWYDLVDELDQSTAGRRDEIANILTQLPRYVAYCKATDADGRAQEHKIQTSSPALIVEVLPSPEKKLREAREQSREQFGIPADWIPEKTLLRRYSLLRVERYRPPGVISPTPLDAPSREGTISRRSPKKKP